MLIDAFVFFNELDLLEVRLQELYSVVDWFVLVESDKTHSGQPKPAHYAANRQRFARWNDKIRHVFIADQEAGTSLAATRRREMGQRNEILKGLLGDPDDTLVMISDLDEIPRREIVAGLPGKIPDGTIGVFIQKLHYYNVNTYAPDRPWPGSRIATAADVRALSPHVIRCGLGQPDGYYPRYGQINNGGWHYSYFGGTDKIQEKMSAFLHQELVSEANSETETIEQRAATGQDIWGRQDEQRFVIGAATDLPWAIRSDPPRWSHFFHKDWQPTFHEDWYTGEQNAYLGWIAQTAPAEGAMIEIGSWEGKSTACLAQTIAPRQLIAVDTWQGSPTEGDDHPTLKIIRSGRDIQATFHRNMELLTPHNVKAVQSDWRDWVATWDGPIALAHIDAAHDYESVRDCLVALLPFVVPNGVICGDDAYMSGVYNAIHEVLGDSVMDVGGRLWIWRKE